MISLTWHLWKLRPREVEWLDQVTQLVKCGAGIWTQALWWQEPMLSLHHYAHCFYHYLLGARHPYILSSILSSNWDAHSADVGTEAGSQGPLSSTHGIWIWTLLLRISSLPFLWMILWSQRMFNSICWMGLIMKCNQSTGNSWTHRSLHGLFLAVVSRPLQELRP